MGVVTTFHRVSITALEDQILPAFRAAFEQRSMTPLARFIDLERFHTKTGHEPGIVPPGRFLWRRSPARFVPSAGMLLGAALGLDDEDEQNRGRTYDADTFLFHVRKRVDLLAKEDWQRLDDLLDWGHHLPEFFRGEEGPYGYLDRSEIQDLRTLLRKLKAALTEPSERADVDHLCEFLSATEPSDGIVIGTR